MAGNTYNLAPAVEKLARSLVEKSAEFKDVGASGITVRAIFQTARITSQGRPLIAKSQLVGGRVSAMVQLLSLAAPVDVEGILPYQQMVIFISKPAWDLLDDKQREALVHEQLCHLNLDKTDAGEWRVSFVAEDVRTFEATVKRYGAWNAELANVVKKAYATQGALDLGEDPDEGEDGE